MSHILKCHDINKTDFVRAANCHLFDAAGARYTDFESGCWCTALGYNHPRINQVLKAQIDRVIHLGTRYPNALAEEAARQVLDLVGLKGGKGLFLSSGSEAVEFGVDAARRIVGRPKLLTFTHSYLAAYGSAGKKDRAEWELFDWSRGPHTDPCAGLDRVPFETLSGFVFEPGGSGTESVRFPAPALIDEIAARVRRSGGLIVANEVTTGFGRTGKWFGFQHYDLQPDIVVLGKALGNGYPVSAVALSGAVADKLEAGGIHHAQSHQNDPLGCAVALEVLAVLREQGWIEKGNALGRRFLAGLEQLARKHPLVKEARGRGLLLALEFHPRPGFSTEMVYDALLRNRFLVAHSPSRNFLRFDPALTMDEDEIARLLECLDRVLSALEGLGECGAPATAG